MGAVSGRPLGGVIVSGPGHGQGQEGGPWDHQLYHKCEWGFAIPAAQNSCQSAMHFNKKRIAGLQSGRQPGRQCAAQVGTFAAQKKKQEKGCYKFQFANMTDRLCQLWHSFCMGVKCTLEVRPLSSGEGEPRMMSHPCGIVDLRGKLPCELLLCY